MAVVGGSALKIVEFAVVPLLFFGVEQGIDSGIFRESTNPLEVALSLWAISTSMIQMNDIQKHILENIGHSEMPFADINFLDIITINAKRIIFTILKNPPADFDCMK